MLRMLRASPVCFYFIVFEETENDMLDKLCLLTKNVKGGVQI